MRTTLRLLALLCAALFSIPAPAQPVSTGVPTTYNLRPVAFRIINAGDSTKGVGHVNLIQIGDSISTPLGVTGRGGVGPRDAWRPYCWSGWHGYSSFTMYNVAPTALDQTIVGTPAINNAAGYPNYTPGTSTPINGAATWGCNHYDYANGASIGDRHQAVQSTLTDSHTGLPLSPSPASSTFAPFGYREWVFSGNVATSEVVTGFSFDYRSLDRFNSVVQPASTATKFGNWTTAGDVVRCRLIYYANPDAPAALNWVPTRGNTAGTAVPFDPSAATGIRYVDCDLATATTSSNGNRPYPELRGGSGNETGKVLPIVGYRFWRPNTPGLEIQQWTQSGFALTTMADAAIWDTTSRAEYFEAIGWPDVAQVWLGQNQSNTETTELNAGTTTTFKTDYRTLLSRIDALYTAAGRPVPQYILISPYCLSNEALTTAGRNTTNYVTMDRAIYELAVERGAAFFSFYQLAPTPHESQGDGSAYVPLLFNATDDVHPVYAGTMYFYSAMWSAMRYEVDHPPPPLRGRQRRGITHKHRERLRRRRRTVPA